MDDRDDVTTSDAEEGVWPNEEGGGEDRPETEVRDDEYGDCSAQTEGGDLGPDGGTSEVIDTCKQLPNSAKAAEDKSRNGHASPSVPTVDRGTQTDVDDTFLDGRPSTLRLHCLPELSNRARNTSYCLPPVLASGMVSRGASGLTGTCN